MPPEQQTPGLDPGAVDGEQDRQVREDGVGLGVGVRRAGLGAAGASRRGTSSGPASRPRVTVAPTWSEMDVLVVELEVEWARRAAWLHFSTPQNCTLPARESAIDVGPPAERSASKALDRDPYVHRTKMCPLRVPYSLPRSQ